MSWTAVRDSIARKWTFHDTTKHPFINRSGPGEIVHGFQTLAEAMQWADEREKQLRAREDKRVSDEQSRRLC
jgi:hypothetical protein